MSEIQTWLKCPSVIEQKKVVSYISLLYCMLSFLALGTNSPEYEMLSPMIWEARDLPAVPGKKEKTEVKDNSIVNTLKLDHLGEVARKMQLCWSDPPSTNFFKKFMDV